MSYLKPHTPDYFWIAPSSFTTTSIHPYPRSHPARTWPNHQSTTTTPSPSPFRTSSAIQLERTYLLTSLQTHSQQIIHLHKTLLLLSNPQIPHLASPNDRKLRKKIGWMKHRLQQAIAQERIISLRLSQLEAESQAREQWLAMEREHERQRPETWYGAEEQILGYQRGLCDGFRIAIPLNPASVLFQPDISIQAQGCPGPQFTWPIWKDERWEDEPELSAVSTFEPSQFSAALEFLTSRPSPYSSSEFSLSEYGGPKRASGRRSASLDLGLLGEGTGTLFDHVPTNGEHVDGEEADVNMKDR
ncbi:uncharacterized protein RSE6_01588 [Rhynchosporium secalis]|uniref:Uncharacterized protein n=1 Tax=Rhynchosporium secalis TaxID=38038 RepID=A0A1E1LY67_RHYSE|nr:uncharacterized protein RSE6_01588 [Rhynchosporium secalis]